MKKNKIYNNLLLSGCLLLLGGLTSCNDFLTVHPTNQITEEEYWQDKNDLENAVSGCYKQELNLIAKMIIWGEARSDNFDLSTEDYTDMRNYMNANLLYDNSIVNWDAFYTGIGYCNNVLKHGPDVVNRDLSFSEEDWKPIEAEMKALRALNYFYLVRSFRDIPFNFDACSTDEEALAQKKPQLSAEVVLDTLINDLDSVKDNGMLQYGSTVFDKGRFTKWSIYTLLADIYLWRAAKNASPDSVAKYPDRTGDGYASQSARDYAKVIEYCDVVINHYLDEYNKNHTGFGQIQEEDETNPYHLNKIDIRNTTTDVLDDVYDALFSQTNSDEGIFELQFDGTRNTNGVLSSYNSGAGLFTATSSSAYTGRFVGSSVCQNVGDDLDNTSALFAKTDTRRWQSMVYTEAGQRVYPIGKYVYESLVHRDLEDNTEGADITKKSVMGNANWIVYRISDVLLMKAEALNYLYDDQEHRQQALDLVSTILYRANPTVTDENKKLSIGNYNTRDNMGALIMRERRREFFAEGKRWYDLVRMAEREASTTNMLSLLLTKYSSNSSAIKAKTSTLSSLYNPIYKAEMDVNPYLVQNPAWKKDETITRN